MPHEFDLQTFILQIIVIFIIILLIYNLFRISRSLRYEKRITKFSISSPKEKELSFFDLLFNKVWDIVTNISKVLSISKAIQKSSKKYEKYISYEEKEIRKSIDFIALKLLISFIAFIIYFFFVALGYFRFSLFMLLIIIIFSYFILNIIEEIKFNKKRFIIENDLYKAITIMNNAFKAGANIMQAIEIVPKELEGAIGDEFSKIYNDLKYGINIEESFKRFHERIELDDAQYIASSLSLLNNTGGNIISVFDTVERSLINKRKLRNELKSTIAASLFVYRLLVFIPVIFILIILILNPSFFIPLFNNILGLFISLIIALLYIFYIVIIKEVLRVKI